MVTVYVDNRNWPRYNEVLAQRGEIFLDLDAMEEWTEELKEMNCHKEGTPYGYPEGNIKLLIFIYLLFHLPYRQTEGSGNVLSWYMTGLMAPCYSAINKRANRLNVKLALDDIQPDETVTIAVDSTGVKLTAAIGFAVDDGSGKAT